MAAGITMDGKLYRVRVLWPTVEESASLVEGPNAGDMLSGRHERDLVGTFCGHTMSVEPDPRYSEDYDSFYDAITAPVDFHEIVMPHGQGTVTYDAMVSSVRHTCRGSAGGVRRWSGLSVSFESIRPVRLPEGGTA